MRIFFILVCAFSTLSALTGCGGSKVNVPKYQAPKMPDFSKLRELTTCSKKESEQTFSSEALANRVVIEDQIETKDIEYIDCDGKVTRRTHGPIGSVTKVLDLAPPQGLSEEINFVEIENQRTCVVIRADVVPDSELLDEIELPDGKKLKIGTPFTKVGRSGAIKLSITDTNLKLFNQLNVTDGANAVQVRYLGKCIEYRNDRDEKLGESRNCARADLISTLNLVIDLKISRPEVSGVHRVNQCKNK